MYWIWKDASALYFCDACSGMKNFLLSLHSSGAYCSCLCIYLPATFCNCWYSKPRNVFKEEEDRKCRSVPVAVCACVCDQVDDWYVSWCHATIFPWQFLPQSDNRFLGISPQVCSERRYPHAVWNHCLGFVLHHWFPGYKWSALQNRELLLLLQQQQQLSAATISAGTGSLDRCSPSSRTLPSCGSSWRYISH